MISDLSHFQEFAFALVWALGRASAIAVISFLVAWVICRAIPKLPPAIKCWIWRLAFVRVLISLFPAAVVALPLLRSEPSPQIQIAADTFINDESVSSAKPAPTSPLIKPIDDGEVKSSRLPFIVLSIWLGGVVSGCGLLAIRWSRTNRLRKRCSVVTDASVLSAFRQIVRDLGVRHPPPLYQSDEVDSPLLLGLIRPRIVIPQSMLMADAASLRMMLAHELAHFRRHDTRWAMLPMLTRLLFWFHPLVILAEREMDAWREIACDDAAIAAGDASVPDYARMLLVVAAASSRKIPLMAIGVIRSRSTLRRRILAMQTFNSWSGRRRTIIAAAIAGFGVCGVIPWTLTAQHTQAISAQSSPATRPAGGTSATQPDASDVPVVEVTSVGVVQTDAVTMRASLDGVVQVMCKLGDRVQRGQLLAQFDTSVFAAELTKAEAALRKDQRELDGARTLRNAVSQSQISAEEFAVVSDETEVELKKHQLVLARTLTPLNGIVSEVAVHEGEFVTKGEALVTIVSISDPRVSCAFPATLYPKLHVGQYVRFKTLDIYKEPFNGHIDFIAPMADTKSGTMVVRAVMDDPNNKLHPGLSGVMSVWVPQ